MKADTICFDTLSASNAVSTKYIIPIIFCLGVSFPPAMIYLFCGFGDRISPGKKSNRKITTLVKTETQKITLTH